MHLLKNYMFLLLSLIENAPMDQGAPVSHEIVAQVSTLVTGLVKKLPFSNCHLVLLTTKPHSLVFTTIRK